MGYIFEVDSLFDSAYIKNWNLSFITCDKALRAKKSFCSSKLYYI